MWSSFIPFQILLLFANLYWDHILQRIIIYCFSLLIFCYIGYDLCFVTYVEFLLTYLRYYDKYNKLSWSYVSESRTQVHTTLQQLAALKVKRFLHIPHNCFRQFVSSSNLSLRKNIRSKMYYAVNPILGSIFTF